MWVSDEEAERANFPDTFPMKATRVAKNPKGSFTVDREHVTADTEAYSISTNVAQEDLTVNEKSLHNIRVQAAYRHNFPGDKQKRSYNTMVERLTKRGIQV